MAAASCDANKDLELHSEPGPSRNQSMFRLPKNICNKIIISLFISLLIVVLLPIYLIFVGAVVQIFQNYHAVQPEKNPAEVVIAFGPNGPLSYGKSADCGGVIDVKMIGTTTMQLLYAAHPLASVACTWIIKSDAKMVNLTLSNGKGQRIPNDEFLVVELVYNNELHQCRNIGQVSGTTAIIRTPAILQIQPSATYTSLVQSEIDLTPVLCAGTHKSQPAAYKYVNGEPRGSVAISNDGPEGLHGIVAVFENNNNRRLVCSSGEEGSEQCCKSVKAYEINSTKPSSSSTAVAPLASNVSRGLSTVVVLSSPQAGFSSPNCQLIWEEA